MSYWKPANRKGYLRKASIEEFLADEERRERQRAKPIKATPPEPATVNGRAVLQVAGVYDIETEGWSKYVLGGLLLADGTYRSFDWRREHELVDAMLAVRGVLWAHNGGRYDALWFLEHIHRRKIKATVALAGQRIVGITIGPKNDRLEVRDSYAIVPINLQEASEIAGNTRKSDSTGLDCACGTDCGGYCAIRRRLSRSKMQALDSYLRADCEATLALLEKIRAYATEKDLDISATIGASAYRTASRWAGIRPARWTPKAPCTWSDSEVYSFVRKGYYGGRVQVFRPRALEGYRYDINSAYPAALASLVLPCGKPRMVDHGARYLDSHEGVFEAEVFVPLDTFAPPLPYRCPGRLAYPVGRFTGHWTGIELRAARDTFGARILRVGRACVFPRRGAILSGFARRVWGMRDEAGKKTALGKWLKLYANSLTGKLAQRPEIETVVFCDKYELPPVCDSKGDCSPDECSGKCGAWERLGDSDEIFIKKGWRIPRCGHVHWAAYLTAWTRIELLKQLTYGGTHDAVYCDTDSVFSLLPRSRGLGTHLGGWLFEGRFHDLVALAPKTYAFESEKDGALGFVAKAKGAPGARDEWEGIFDGKPIQIDRGVMTFKTAVRKGVMFERKKAHRYISLPDKRYGDRILDGDVTRPCTLEELATL